MPLRLSDEELSAVMSAARPIAVERRDAFLQDVAHALASCAEVGPGVVHRVCASVQRGYFDPPEFQHSAGAQSKYRR